MNTRCYRLHVGPLGVTAELFDADVEYMVSSLLLTQGARKEGDSYVLTNDLYVTDPIAMKAAVDAAEPSEIVADDRVRDEVPDGTASFSDREILRAASTSLNAAKRQLRFVGQDGENGEFAALRLKEYLAKANGLLDTLLIAEGAKSESTGDRLKRAQLAFAEAKLAALKPIKSESIRIGDVTVFARVVDGKIKLEAKTPVRIVI